MRTKRTEIDRMARAVRAACDYEPWEPGCDYPLCRRRNFICWNGFTPRAVVAAIKEWEKKQ